jgi:N-acetylmuramoyl-L-alanine amidase
MLVTLVTVLAPAAAGAQGRAAPARRAPAPLPPIPHVAGPLRLVVAYPAEAAQLGARDSTFLFGSTGSGDATLTINGEPVSVAPNGAFLAFLPLADDSVATFRLLARTAGDSAVLTRRVRLPHRFVPPPGLWIDRASIVPSGNRWVEPGELVRVTLRATPGAEVRLVMPDGAVVPLAPDTGSLVGYGPFERRPGRMPERQAARFTGAFAARALGSPLPPVTAPRVPPVTGDSGLARIIAVRGADTARASLPLRLALLDPDRRAVVRLDDDTARTGVSDGAAIGRPMPEGTYEWFFRNGPAAAARGRAGDELRLALSRASSAWVLLADVAGTFPEGTPPPLSRVGLVRLVPGDSSVTARVALSSRLPFHVEEGDRILTLRLYGAQSDLDWLQYGGTDSLVPRMTWAQPAADEVTVTLELSRPVFGFRARWEGSDLLIEVRRPPAIDPRRPLRGRTIAVDPGHPPLGAIGPTGLAEAEANLGIGLALRRLLERAGARVVMTRTTDTAIGLYERTTLAESADAELLVSLHNNAFPDGVNPFANHGTSTYYFHPRAARLAFLVQEGLLRQLGLRNLGVGRGNYALVRPTWMPAILTEGAFLMIPEQENALRTTEFRERYARGVLEGVEAYLRELARAR